jgi:hypothetical protein
MRFTSEIDLRDHFWKMYSGSNKNIIAYQFEAKARTGATDLVTIEKVKNKDRSGFHIEICSFEFKLDDLQKVFAQAYANSSFSHKSFVVVPANKRKAIEDNYTDYYKKYPSIGCIAVDHPEDNGGRYKMFHYAHVRLDSELQLNQEILKLCCKVI